MQQKIFVTGGTGFLGAYLLRYLVAQGHQNILALKRVTSSMALIADIADKIEWVEGDVLDIPFLEDVMEGVQQVYHCAAIVSFDPKEAKKMMQVNVEGTANIVNVALYRKIDKLVHISSIAALGSSKPEEWQDEKTNWKEDKKNSNYAKSKYLSEMEVWRGIMEGLNAAILNPGLIIGSGFWEKGTGKIFNLYSDGFPFYSAGTVGIVDVRDVAKLAIQLMESDIKEERFIISSENMPYQTLFHQIATFAEAKPPSVKMTRWMTSIGWRLEWLRSALTGKSPTLTKETISSASNQTYYQNKKSIDTFDFQYTPIQQTIAETVQQYKEAKTNGLRPMVLPLT